MSKQTAKQFLLPASIPFARLKSRDLEECVYWLLDAMGAKDLRWRAGGSGGGAADGGRDLEAYFYSPVLDGELEAQKWWIECKGRTGTVEPNEVKAAANNALAIDGLDYLVITTNTQFSNPTQDWVKEWQRKHPRPKVKLWDHAHLERYLSRHPDVVLRLFSEALSLQGRLHAMESRFWNKVEFSPPQMLADLWKSRTEIHFTALAMLAVIANEFAHGDIVSRPWATTMDGVGISEVLSLAVQNIIYFALRCSKLGVEQAIIFRSIAYLVLAALDSMPIEAVGTLVIGSLNHWEKDGLPESLQEQVLTPIAQQLLGEMQDVCTSDCKRIMLSDPIMLGKEKNEVPTYWLRFEPREDKPEEEERHLIMEKHDAPCVVGFPVDKDYGCPLFGFEPTVANTNELLTIIKRVAAYRKAQAAEKRRSGAARTRKKG